ncbi:MAG TPA: TlpA disulfide reductase family protein [Bacteroidales bacterium]|jgi:peroxiredoxin|nr:TlpA disulfide reductase family protein [Bacteroidales bacterium]HQK67211.1 TlpA disulfide reductase family protein [Bacteroidales bacterium]
MMNKSWICILVLLVTITGCKNNNIEINGKLLDPTPGKYLYLDELKSTELITVDSAIINEDGRFSFIRKVEYPSFYLLKADEKNYLTMLLEPGQKIGLNAYSDSLNYPVFVTGSEGTSLMVAYNKRLRRTVDQLSGLRSVYMLNLGSPQLVAVIERLDSLAQIYLNDLNTYTKKYIDDNLNSLVSLVALYQQVAPGEYVLHHQKDLKYFLKVDSSLSKLYPDYEPVQSLHAQVQSLLSDLNAQNLMSPLVSAGSEAPEIALPDPQGDTIRLSSTRGKVVLLDFWASWCNPCRKENPNLVKAYNTYHDKGFEIFQVSLDKTKDAWLEGIRKDNLEKWIHVSDIKYWNSIVVPLYKFEVIPTNYLLDKDGRIIASNLRGEDLNRKLAEIFAD